MRIVHENKNAHTPAQEQTLYLGAARVAALFLLKPGLERQSWRLKGPSWENQKDSYKDKQTGEEGSNKIKAGADIQSGCREWFRLKQTGGSKETKNREEIEVMEAMWAASYSEPAGH